jgi:hypothetical protein
MFFLRRRDQSECSFLAALAAPLFRTSADKLEAALKSADRLDLVEFVMDVEEAMNAANSP